MNKNIQFNQAKKALHGIDREIVCQVIEEQVKKHGYSIGEINYIFMTDEELLQINKEHLDHNYYTDILTFDLSEKKGEITSDIFISEERVKDNAETIDTPVMNETLRVMFHGIMHLCGFKDKTQEEEKEMRKVEDECLNLYFQYCK